MTRAASKGLNASVNCTKSSLLRLLFSLIEHQFQAPRFGQALAIFLDLNREVHIREFLETDTDCDFFILNL
ncbi:hypothetical protein C7C56_008150 [Massilia glaciei]|uniref:Uncharacterized protein n=1 Tax=Massilia glaciei TaxID=1524097 RepID=A0A2U2HNQ2_9BURK|nr:hypothetical protein C7C56_008150 [Massilia glaciei]